MGHGGTHKEGSICDLLTSISRSHGLRNVSNCHGGSVYAGLRASGWWLCVLVAVQGIIIASRRWTISRNDDGLNGTSSQFLM